MTVDEILVEVQKVTRKLQSNEKRAEKVRQQELTLKAQRQALLDALLEAAK